MPVDVFISYASEDRAYLQNLGAHLALLHRQGVLRAWHSELIVPGQDWDAEVTQRLQSARVIILLVSANFFSSDVAYTQMERAINRARQGNACVIPILLRPCLRQGASLDGLSKLPDNNVPISGWPDQDAAWENVARGIHRAIVELGRGNTVSPITVYPDQVPADRAGGATAQAVQGRNSSPTIAKPSSVSTLPPRASFPTSMVKTPPPRVRPRSSPLIVVVPAIASAAALCTVAWHCTRGTAPTAAEQLSNRSPGASGPLAMSEPPSKRSPGALRADQPATVAQPSAASTGARPLGQPERGWIEAYGAAIDSGNVDRILALHVLPTPRFFAATNQDAAQLRKLYQGWFDNSGRIHRTGFDGCSLANVAPDGARALRCTTYVDPPFPNNKPSRVPSCLVFTRAGKLLSRTEISHLPDCPPH